MEEQNEIEKLKLIVEEFFTTIINVDEINQNVKKEHEQIEKCLNANIQNKNNLKKIYETLKDCSEEGGTLLQTFVDNYPDVAKLINKVVDEITNLSKIKETARDNNSKITSIKEEISVKANFVMSDLSTKLKITQVEIHNINSQRINMQKEFDQTVENINKIKKDSDNNRKRINQDILELKHLLQIETDNYTELQSKLITEQEQEKLINEINYNETVLEENKEKCKQQTDQFMLHRKNLKTILSINEEKIQDMETEIEVLEDNLPKQTEIMENINAENERLGKDISVLMESINETETEIKNKEQEHIDDKSNFEIAENSYKGSIEEVQQEEIVLNDNNNLLEKEQMETVIELDSLKVQLNDEEINLKENENEAEECRKECEEEEIKMNNEKNYLEETLKMEKEQEVEIDKLKLELEIQLKNVIEELEKTNQEYTNIEDLTTNQEIENNFAIENQKELITKLKKDIEVYQAEMFEEEISHDKAKQKAEIDWKLKEKNLNEEYDYYVKELNHKFEIEEKQINQELKALKDKYHALETDHKDLELSKMIQQKVLDARIQEYQNLKNDIPKQKNDGEFKKPYYGTPIPKNKIPASKYSSSDSMDMDEPPVSKKRKIYKLKKNTDEDQKKELQSYEKWCQSMPKAQKKNVNRKRSFKKPL